MKWFFGLLLLANVALAAAQYFNPEWLPWNRPDTRPIDATRPGVEPLILLSEIDPITAPQGNFSSGSVTKVCYRLGPYPSKADVRRALAEISDQVDSARQEQTVESQDIGHWVFLPAVSTRDEALADARELAGAGVSDYYVVTAGDQENTVSLGLFSSLANAERRVAQIQALGFSPQMRVRQEELPVYWLDYAAEPGVNVAWQDALDIGRRAQRSETSCNA